VHHHSENPGYLSASVQMIARTGNDLIRVEWDV